jgi:hypothetical protein
MHHYTALIEAAMHGNLEAAEDALRGGADANATLESCSALFWAAQEGHTPIITESVGAVSIQTCASGGIRSTPDKGYETNHRSR